MYESDCITFYITLVQRKVILQSYVTFLLLSSISNVLSQRGSSIESKMYAKIRN